MEEDLSILRLCLDTVLLNMSTDIVANTGDISGNSETAGNLPRLMSSASMGDVVNDISFYGMDVFMILPVDNIKSVGLLPILLLSPSSPYSMSTSTSTPVTIMYLVFKVEIL